MIFAQYTNAYMLTLQNILIIFVTYFNPHNNPKDKVILSLLNRLFIKFYHVLFLILMK